MQNYLRDMFGHFVLRLRIDDPICRCHMTVHRNLGDYLCNRYYGCSKFVHNHYVVHTSRKFHPYFRNIRCSNTLAHGDQLTRISYPEPRLSVRRNFVFVIFCKSFHQGTPKKYLIHQSTLKEMLIWPAYDLKYDFF